ncbi:MAG: hypothetical protein ACXV4B_09475 [Halobacteriota archaeon]
MSFVDIVLGGIDFENVERTARDTVLVPYVLSDRPTREWVQYFLARINGQLFSSQGPVKFTADLPRSRTEIVDNKVIFECAKDKKRIKEPGDCWDIVAAHVEAANEQCRKLDEQKSQQRELDEIARQNEEQRSKEFEEFKRDLRSE